MDDQPILVVEDDEHIRLALVENLRDEGFDVDAAASVGDARTLIETRRFTLVLLDLMLPDGDGYALCRELRQNDAELRIVMLTARTLEEDVVRGFEAGADDYVAKPYRLGELFARVRSQLRRAQGGSTLADLPGFKIDASARRVTAANGREVELTRTEFDLLHYLVTHEGQALHRDDILAAVWGEVVVEPRTIDNFISSLKKKLRWTAQSEFAFSAVRGVGYRFERVQAMPG